MKLYIAHQQAGISLEIFGPFSTHYKLQTNLLDLIKLTSGLLNPDGFNNVYKLEIKDGKLLAYDFAGGYIDNLREIINMGDYANINPDYPLYTPDPKRKRKAT